MSAFAAGSALWCRLASPRCLCTHHIMVPGICYGRSRPGLWAWTPHATLESLKQRGETVKGVAPATDLSLPKDRRDGPSILSSTNNTHYYASKPSLWMGTTSCVYPTVYPTLVAHSDGHQLREVMTRRNSRICAFFPCSHFTNGWCFHTRIRPGNVDHHRPTLDPLDASG